MDKRWARLFGISEKYDESDIRRFTFGGTPLPVDKVLIVRNEQGIAEFAWLRFADEVYRDKYIGLCCDDDETLTLI